MAITLDNAEISEDIAAYLDWALETGLWDGRLVSRFEASEFSHEVAAKLFRLLEDPDNPLCERFFAQCAWIGTPEADRSLLAREIQALDFSKGDLILQAGFKKSLKKFWKQHKKGILLGALAVVLVTVAIVVTVSSAGAAGAAGGATLAALEEKKKKQPKPLPKKETAAAPPPPPPLTLSNPIPSTQLVFEDKGITFNNEFTSYHNILLNRVEPTPVISPYSPPQSPPMDLSQPFRDVQPHYIAHWNQIDSLNEIPPYLFDPIPEQMPRHLPDPIREQTPPHSIDPILEQAPAISELLPAEPQPVEQETPWLTNFLDSFGKALADNSNSLAPHFSRPEFEVSKMCSTDGNRVPGMAIGCGNGMNTSLEEAIDHANHLAKFTHGHCVDLMYNNSHGPVVDVLEITTLNLRGVSPNTAFLHRQAWEQFHEANLDRPKAKYLQFGHSQDSIHILNALKKAPSEIQQRVIVILFGPAVVIPKGLCFRVRHYACKGDLVPYGKVLDANLWGGFFMASEVASKHEDIIWLEPHPETKSPHDFQNPTFNDTKRDTIDAYIEKNGEYENSEADVINSHSSADMIDPHSLPPGIIIYQPKQMWL